MNLRCIGNPFQNIGSEIEALLSIQEVMPMITSYLGAILIPDMPEVL
jgi:hypothetical protein